MTNQELNAENIGAELGTEGVGSLVNKVEAYCSHEKERIAFANEPRIVALRAEAGWLLDEERDLVERSRHAPPPCDLRSRRRKAIYYACVTAFLTAAAMVFSLYSFEPFRLGLKAYLYCLGIAIVTPFLVERVIEWWKAETLIKSLTTAACVAAILSLVLLAVIRGNIMAQQMTDSTPVITFDDAPQQSEPQQNSFYDRTTPILQLVMALLAFAMELGAGLALHEAWRLASDRKEDWAKLRKRLADVRGRLAELAFEITALQRAPQAFAARFWRNFYHAMLTDTLRSAMTKLLVVLVSIVFIAHGSATARAQTTIVVAVDLTKSEDVRGPDGKTEFQKNLEAVTWLLAEVPADSHVTVIGITDRSFSQPDILLSASVPADEGYFGERLNSARGQLVRVWKARSATLTPRYRSTDVLGAVMLADQLYDQRAGRKVFAIYSDMRHHTKELDLESQASIPRFEQVSQGRDWTGVSLKGVEVHVLGADGTRTSVVYWDNLRRFWTEFFHSTGAAVKDYSSLRLMRLEK